MARVRVGVRGYTASGPAETREEVVAGRQIVWVEIDGTRIDGTQLISVGGNWGGQGFHVTEVSFIGLPEFVYLDRDEKELP
jgi:hypothetical protein